MYISCNLFLFRPLWVHITVDLALRICLNIKRRKIWLISVLILYKVKWKGHTKAKLWLVLNTYIDLDTWVERLLSSRRPIPKLSVIIVCSGVDTAVFKINKRKIRRVFMALNRIYIEELWNATRMSMYTYNILIKICSRCMTLHF